MTRPVDYGLVEGVRSARGWVLLGRARAELQLLADRVLPGCDWGADPAIGDQPPPPGVMTCDRMRWMVMVACQRAQGALRWILNDSEAKELEKATLESAQVTLGGQTFVGERGL